jgi:hypothetical protein
MALQQKLIQSLEVLQPAVVNPRRLKSIIQLLKESSIPNQDYQKVFDFITLYLLPEMAEIVDAKPLDKKLHDLCIYCVNHLPAPSDELRTKKTPRKRN